MNRLGDGERYSRVARSLHWIIAALVLGNIAGGMFNDSLSKLYEGITQLHKSVGLTIIVLTICRIGWRLTHKPPPLPDSVPPFELVSAGFVHGLFYTLLLLMPLTGWIFVSAGKYPLSWFWLVDVPKFALTKADPIVGLARSGHEIMGWTFLALATLHIAAALRHHFIVKDAVLRRMWG